MGLVDSYELSNGKKKKEQKSCSSGFGKVEISTRSLKRSLPKALCSDP